MNIKMMFEAWSQVEERATSEDSAISECPESRGVPERSSNSSLYYNDGEPNDVLQGEFCCPIIISGYEVG